jgi:hypothetical protein
MDKYAGNQNQSVASYPAIHNDPVTCLAPFKAGYCLSGSKDQVSGFIVQASIRSNQRL